MALDAIVYSRVFQEIDLIWSALYMDWPTWFDVLYSP
jgi:hypothetical protein